MDKLKRTNGLLKKETAIEVIASNIGVDHKIVAEKIGISAPTMRSWLTDADFIEDVYIRYMEIAGFELPAVIQATIGEAKRGNVHAARLILEHFGKLENKLKIQVESNFEKFMKTDTKDADFFDITDKQSDALDVVSEHLDNTIQLPERDSSNNDPENRRKQEKKRLTQRTSAYSRAKTKKAKTDQNERYKIRTRAKAVGLELLSPGRHSRSERDKWMQELEKREKNKV
jgi:hypothetical protein|tara:strand:- start:19 stop:705 length:687 start_codon:yes stop_codon:yes gene_type:complete